MDLRKLFLNPPAEYRSAPFWSWNDKLDPKEIAWQVRQMKEQGMGGFFMHSREGLETEYLGSEWMECIRAAVEAAQKEGIAAWLYDEDRWPSGAAGGLVSKKGDAYRAKALTFELSSDLPEDEELLAVFRVKVQGNELISLQEGRGPLQEGEKYVLLRRELASPTPWYNDEAPADNLNPEAVKAFIQITHEAYKREIGEHFGKAVPGVFTDEPNIFHVTLQSGRRAVPWTDGFNEYFRAKRGYDFLSCAPYLFLDGEKSEKIRHDYWYTITQRFVSAFSQQLGDWCEEHGILLTGHYLAENLLGTATWLGGAIMPHYCHMQLPGIDILREQTCEYLTVKQCTSVANQLGKKRVLSETYGCTGWEFSFEGQKWIGDWQYVMGINLRCQHLSLYSLRGCRKRDYPPSYNYNTTWWSQNRVVEDYFARLSAVLSQGKPVRELLVLHPQGTAWALLSDCNREEVDAFGDKLNQLARELLARKIDFDFGDELIMAEHGKVSPGEFVVGEASYKALLLPECSTLLSSTVALVEEFLDKGGKVIILGRAPEMVEAEAQPHLRQLWEKDGVFNAESHRKLFQLLEEILPPRVKITDELGLPIGSILCMEREVAGKAVYFLVNNDRDKGYKARIQLPVWGKVEEFDPLTGDIREVAVGKGEELEIEAYFSPAGSKLYAVDLAAAPQTAAPEKITFETYELSPIWQHKRTLPNILPLDYCSWRLAGEEWSGPLPLWQAQYQLRERLGMRQVHVNGIQQRYIWVKDPHPQDGVQLELLFKFKVQALPRTLELILEGADLFEVFLNEEKAEKPHGWFLDKSMGRIQLPVCRIGENQLLLRCKYYQWMEVEDCFLAGDFGVDDKSCELQAEPEALRCGDWCLQGYPFYPGSMLYQTTYHHLPGERVFLSLEADAITVSVEVNGKEAGKIPWRQAVPLELTELLQEGENQIQIEVFASPRNMLGPLHRRERQMLWTDSRSFRTEGDGWTDQYVLWPFGLKKATLLVR